VTETNAEERQDTRELTGQADGARFELVSEDTGGSIAQAREAVRRFLHRNCAWAPSLAVTLVVSELVTNAVRHTSAGWWRLGLTADGHCLMVEVEDASSEPPQPRAGSLVGEGGLGLGIVARLAPRLEVQPAPVGEGKTVRAIWSRA
jgi:anti-sigma regulatory factor (Ser/Thr protein kinase)